MRINPRMDPVLWSRSAVRGDVNFDMKVDGADYAWCSNKRGKTVTVPGNPAESLMGVDLDFDPRCDLVEDGVIDDADLALVAP